MIVPRVPILLLILIACQRQEQEASKQNTKPSTIVILADDMGFSYLGCTGSEIEAPNLDVLANNGLLFTNCYNTSRCCPTRASLLTGVYQHRAGYGHMERSGHNHVSGTLSSGCGNYRTITLAS